MIRHRLFASEPVGNLLYLHAVIFEIPKSLFIIKPPACWGANVSIEIYELLLLFSITSSWYKLNKLSFPGGSFCVIRLTLFKSGSEVFSGIAAPKNFVTFTRKHLRWRSIFRTNIGFDPVTFLNKVYITGGFPWILQVFIEQFF